MLLTEKAYNMDIFPFSSKMALVPRMTVSCLRFIRDTNILLKEPE